MTAVIRDNPLGFAADNWFVVVVVLAIAAVMFTADAVRKVRRRRRITPRHRHAMHRFAVRYGRPGLGRRAR